jgi:hypothetical protein
MNAFEEKTGAIDRLMEVCYQNLIAEDANDSAQLTAAALRIVYQADLLWPEFEVAMNAALERVAFEVELGLLAPRQ